MSTAYERHRYMVLPRLNVRNANAQPVWWVIGAPAITAYAGFVHALCLAAGKGGHDGVAVVHHDLQPLGETVDWAYRPHQFRAASFVDEADYVAGTGCALSSQPSARCHLSVSIVVRLSDESTLGADDVSRFMRGARLAGGRIDWDGEAEFHETSAEAQAAVGAGFGLHDRTDLIEQRRMEEDPLDAVLRHCRPAWEQAFPLRGVAAPDTEEELGSVLSDPTLGDHDATMILDWAARHRKMKSAALERALQKWPGQAAWLSRFGAEDQDGSGFAPAFEMARRELSWIQPSCVGFVAISGFEQRANARFGLPHAYAEALTSLVQYRSMREWKAPYWKYTYPRPGVFVARAEYSNERRAQ